MPDLHELAARCRDAEFAENAADAARRKAEAVHAAALKTRNDAWVALHKAVREVSDGL